MIGNASRKACKHTAAARVRANHCRRLARFAARLALAALVAVLAPLVARAEDLQFMRDSVRSAPAPSPAADNDHESHDHESHKHGHSHHYSPSSCDGDLAAICAVGILFTVTSPWWGPHLLARDSLSNRAYFPGAPHINGPGYLEISPYVGECSKPWGMHFQAEYADDFGDFSRIGGRALIEHSSRVGLDTQWNYLNEDLGLAGHDHLWVGDANLVIRFAQNERIAMRSGLGVNWLADDIGGEAGFNFTYGLDYFPCKPLVLSAEIDLGRIGEATLFHGRTTAGVVYGHTEAFIGYDYLDIGDAQINGVIAGVGVWF